PDNNHVFCLDHLRSPLASDEVRVFKNKITTVESLAPPPNSTAAGAQNSQGSKSIAHEDTPYLQLVASKAVDHTAGIIRRLLRAAFILMTNRGGFTGARSSLLTESPGEVTVADFQVDPFDYREMARVNDAVRKFGFCFILEDYTFDRTP